MIISGGIGFLVLSELKRQWPLYRGKWSRLSLHTKLVISTTAILLMFIGASPGSCGGGIKTSSLASLVLLGLSRLRGQPRPQVFHRTISEASVGKALSRRTIARFYYTDENIIVEGRSEIICPKFDKKDRKIRRLNSRNAATPEATLTVSSSNKCLDAGILRVLMGYFLAVTRTKRSGQIRRPKYSIKSSQLIFRRLPGSQKL